MHHCWPSQNIYCNVGVPTLISIMIKKVNTCKFTYYDTWNYFSILLTEVPFLEKLFQKTQWCSNNVEFSTFLFGLTIFWSRWDKYWNNEHKISLGISKPNTFLWKEKWNNHEQNLNFWIREIGTHSVSPMHGLCAKFWAI